MKRLKEQKEKSKQKGMPISEDELRKSFRGKSVAFDADDITEKIIKFGKVLTGMSLYDYQLEAAYAIIYSVITFSGDVKTMLFSRQSGKTETVAFVIDTLCVLLPALSKFLPDLDQFRDGFKVGLFAPQGEQVNTTYSRALSRIKSNSAEMVMSDPDIDVLMLKTAHIDLSNGSFLMGQTASKQSKIESKTYDLVFVEEAQDVDDLVMSKSIEPMVSATGGSIIKVGTTGLTKNHFWYEIQHNRTSDLKLKDKKVRNHFEFDYKRIISDRRKQYNIDGKRYHLNYESDVTRKKERWGEDSQAFKLAYALIWDLETGMLISDTEFNALLNKRIGLQEPDLNDFVVAGIDIGKSPAETVVTIARLEEQDDDLPLKQIIYWAALGNMDYENQHYCIMDLIMNFNIQVIYADYTGVGRAVVDRLTAACGDYLNIVPYTFTTQSKSDMWYNFLSEISCRRIIVPANKKTRETTEFAKFEEQMKNCTKDFKDSYLVCQKSEGYFDDFVDSCALMCLAANSVMGGEDEDQGDIEILENFIYPNTLDTRKAIQNNSYNI